MKCSWWIEQLQKVMNEYGDIEVGVRDDEYGCYRTAVFEVVKSEQLAEEELGDQYVEVIPQRYRLSSSNDDSL